MTWVQRNFPGGASASSRGSSAWMAARGAGAWELDDLEYPHHPELEAVRLAKLRLRGMFAARGGGGLRAPHPGPIGFLMRHPEAAALGALVAGMALTRSGAARSAALGWAGKAAAFWLRSRLLP